MFARGISPQVSLIIIYVVGSILEKVLDDSKEKIKLDDEGVEGMKMLIYSGYSYNIAAVLAATENLDLFKESFGLSLVIELHFRLMTTDYALKVNKSFYLTSAM